MKVREITTVIHEFDSLSELDPEERNLVERARKAAEQAYAPYSGFKVGACVRLANGEIFVGNNQENAAYPSGVCAERVAISAAATSFPDIPVKTVAITAIYKNDFSEEPVPPCGFCRQVLIESEIRFNTPIRIIMSGREKVQIVENVRQLLPLVFDGSLFLRK